MNKVTNHDTNTCNADNEVHLQNEMVGDVVVSHEKEENVLILHNLVREWGYPNVYGACVSVSSTWNLDWFKEQLCNYDDAEVVEFLMQCDFLTLLTNICKSS